MNTVRMHTRVIAVVHSHLSDEPIDLSEDLIGIRTSKSVKGAGGMSLDLVPRRNFFNLLYPNDVINLYIDPGDGVSGFVRVFMGYIDRVERAEVVDEKGAVNSSFRVSCTDFQKAFERTTIYFNPHLSNRTDLIDPGLGQSLLGGNALMVRGIRAHGTPADMVENLATMLLGFGSQWVLPNSYPANSGIVASNKQRRKNRAKARLPKDLVKSFSDNFGDLDNVIRTERDIEEYVLRNIIDNYSITAAASTVVRNSLEGIPDVSLVKDGILTLRSYQTTIRGLASSMFSVLDLIDLSFIEATSIDGYISSSAIWQSNNINLASIMRTYSNEIVNELMFDLRPVARSTNSSHWSSLDSDEFHDSCFGAEYSREPDELGINVNGLPDSAHFKAGPAAVTYVPAIVLREYPYSCVEGLDLSKLYITDTSTAGFNAFGPIFSTKDDGKDRYRAIYNYLDVPEIAKNKGLSPIACEFSEISAPLKHLDVVTIQDTDVLSSSLGRSDNDVFNFFAMYATDGLEKVYKYMVKHFLPIVTPVSIARNGLRVSEVKTRYANYSRDVLCFGSSAVSSSAILKNMIRWTLLMDHWNQHNHEYLSGEIVLRGMPGIRVGYRLDWEGRNESYYVESVSHAWTYPNEFITTVQVSRGQRNNPFPSYIPPKMSIQQDERFQTLSNGSSVIIEDIEEDQEIKDIRSSFSSGFGVSKIIKDSEFSSIVTNGGGDRSSNGRLSKYFDIVNTPATYRAIGASGNSAQMPSDVTNELDDPDTSSFPGVIEYADSAASRDKAGAKITDLFDPHTLDDGIGDEDE